MKLPYLPALAGALLLAACTKEPAKLHYPCRIDLLRYEGRPQSVDVVCKDRTSRPTIFSEPSYRSEKLPKQGGMSNSRLEGEEVPSAVLLAHLLPHNFRGKYHVEIPPVSNVRLTAKTSDGKDLAEPVEVPISDVGLYEDDFHRYLWDTYFYVDPETNKWQERK